MRMRVAVGNMPRDLRELLGSDTEVVADVDAATFRAWCDAGDGLTLDEFRARHVQITPIYEYWWWCQSCGSCETMRIQEPAYDTGTQFRDDAQTHADMCGNPVRVYAWNSGECVVESRWKVPSVNPLLQPFVDGKYDR